MIDKLKSFLAELVRLPDEQDAQVNKGMVASSSFVLDEFVDDQYEDGFVDAAWNSGVTGLDKLLLICKIVLLILAIFLVLFFGFSVAYYAWMIVKNFIL